MKSYFYSNFSYKVSPNTHKANYYKLLISTKEQIRIPPFLEITREMGS